MLSEFDATVCKKWKNTAKVDTLAKGKNTVKVK